MERKIYSKTERKSIDASIGKKIQEVRRKTIRKQTHKKTIIVSQRYLSQQICETTRFIGNIENNTSKKPLDVFSFINICNALKVSSNSILAEFIPNDLEINAFNQLNEDTKNILKKLVDTLLNSSKENFTEQMETQTFNNAILAQRINDVRNNRKMKSRELSTKINRSHGYINNVEKGISKVTLPALIDICNTLDCTPNDLLQPFLNKNDLNDYKSLSSEHKHLIDTLIKICNEKQQEFGYVNTRMATPEELEKYGIKLK